MKIAGFTFIRNAIVNDYPVVEMVSDVWVGLLIFRGMDVFTKDIWAKHEPEFKT